MVSRGFAGRDSRHAGGNRRADLCQPVPRDGRRQAKGKRHSQSDDDSSSHCEGTAVARGEHDAATGISHGVLKEVGTLHTQQIALRDSIASAQAASPEGERSAPVAATPDLVAQQAAITAGVTASGRSNCEERRGAFRSDEDRCSRTTGGRTKHVGAQQNARSVAAGRFGNAKGGAQQPGVAARQSEESSMGGEGRHRHDLRAARVAMVYPEATESHSGPARGRGRGGSRGVLVELAGAVCRSAG